MMVMGQPLIQGTAAVSANKTKTSVSSQRCYYANNLQCHASAHIWSIKQYYTSLLHYVQWDEHFELHVTLINKTSWTIYWMIIRGIKQVTWQRTAWSKSPFWNANRSLVSKKKMQDFMEHESSLTCSHDPATGSYVEAHIPCFSFPHTFEKCF